MNCIHSKHSSTKPLKLSIKFDLFQNKNTNGTCDKAGRQAITDTVNTDEKQEIKEV
jgi:hypothetical protein